MNFIPASIRRIDAVGVGCFLVALTVFGLNGLNGAVRRDIGVYLYGGQRVLAGELPYEGIANRAGPLAHVFPAAGTGLGRQLGLDDVFGARALFVLISALAVLAIYALGRTIFSSRSTGLVAATTLLAFQGFAYYATNGPREKTPMVLFAVLALIALVNRRWLLTGMLISLATLTWQPVFFPLIAATAAVILASGSWRTWWRAILGVMVGGAVPAGITVAIYAANGELQLFLDWFYLINLDYTTSSSTALDRVWPLVEDGYGWSIWLLACGLTASALGIVWGIWRRCRPSKSDTTRRDLGLIAMGVFTLGGIGWSTRSFDGWPDAFVLLPGAAIGVALVAYMLTSRIPRWQRAGFISLVTAVGIAAAAVHAIETSTLIDVDEHRYTLADQQEQVDAVFDVIPDATLVTLSAPEVSVLAERRNPVRIQLFANGMVPYIDDHWLGGRDGYARWVVDQRADIIVVGHRQARWTAEWLDLEYRKIGTVNRWTWWVSDRVDPFTSLTVDVAVRQGRASPPVELACERYVRNPDDTSRRHSCATSLSQAR